MWAKQSRDSVREGAQHDIKLDKYLTLRERLKIPQPISNNRCQRERTIQALTGYARICSSDLVTLVKLESIRATVAKKIHFENKS